MSFLVLNRTVGSVAFLAFILLLCPAARCQDSSKPSLDTIIFKNGDQLTGKIVRADGSAITFHSDVVGNIKVDWNKVKELRSPQQFAVMVKGQKVNKKTPSSQVEQGTISLKDDVIQVQGASPTSPTPQPIPIKNAALVIDSTSFDKELHYRPSFFHGWDGSISGGASTVQATQNSQAFNLGIVLSRVVPNVDWLAPRNRTTADFNESYGHVTQPNTAAAGKPSNAQNTKTSIYHADAERDEYLSMRFYALGDTAFDHNFSQGLDLQQLYGGGFGLTILKQPKQRLDSKIDVHYEKQSFSGAPSVNLIGSTFGETYMRTLPKGLIFNESGLLDFSFNNTNAYSSNVTGSLIFPVYKRLAFNVGAIDGYLNNPPAGFNENSFQFTTGITYSLR